MYLVLDADLDASNTTFTKLATEWATRDARYQNVKKGTDEIDQLAKGKLPKKVKIRLY